jgi:aminopeptidase N
VGFELSRVRLDTGKGLKAVEHYYDGDQNHRHGSREARPGAWSQVSSRERGLLLSRSRRRGEGSPGQMWSQCQDEDARRLIRATTSRTKMTTSSRFTYRGKVALSMATWSRKGATRKKTWTYRWIRDPLPSYLVTLMVGDFDVVEDRSVDRKGRAASRDVLRPAKRRDDVRSVRRRA